MDAIGSQGSIYQLVQQYMSLERIPRDKLVDQKSVLNEKKSVFTELNTKLSALKTKLTSFTDLFVNPFFAKTSSSSDAERIGISAQGSAVTGNHAIAIERLAKADTRVSNQFNDTENSFGAFSTDQTFTIEVGHPTDEDANNRVQIEVTVPASEFSGTNDEILKAISDSINGAMSQAVADELIDSDEVIHSQIVNEEIGTSRLVMRSEQTGYSYRMDFGSSSLLDTLNVNAATQSSGVSGGYITPIGTSATDSELNAMFTVDGLTFYRDSNVVDDALQGITLKLLDTFTTEETVTVATDVESVKGDVEDFIEKYNDAVKFLRDNSEVDPETFKRGVLSTDFFYSGMVGELRSIVGSSVEGTTSENHTLLYNIGIEANEDGTLSITDSDKFTTALETNALFVSDLFKGDEGIATKLVDYIDGFVSAGGTINSSKQNLDSQISSLNDRISYMDEVLDKKEELYYNEFTKFQEIMYQLEEQQKFFNSFLSY